MRFSIYLFFLFFCTHSFSQNKIEYYNSKAAIISKTKSSEENFTAHIRMKVGEYIWTSLTGTLGIEGARVYYENDSIFIHEKLNHQKSSYHQNHFNNYFQLNLTREKLEDIILYRTIDLMGLWRHTENEHEVYSSYENGSLIRYYYTEKKLSKITINDTRYDNHAEFTFIKFDNISSHQLPSKIKVKILSDYILSDITIQFKNIEVNKFKPISYKK